MNNTKRKSKGLLKTIAAGFALVLSSAFFPASVVTFAENYNGESEVNSNVNRIQIGKEGENYSSKIKKGDSFTIPVGEYYGKSETAKLIGSSDLANSSITVTYKATGEVVLDEVKNKDASFLEGLNFRAEKVGTYVITYKVVDDGKEYTYDMTVISEASEINFEFKSNSERMIPSIYDVKIADDKNIDLPYPVVNDENGDAIIDGEDLDYYVTDKSLATTDNFVLVKLTNGGEDLTIDTDEDGKMYIDGSTISEKAATIDGQEFKITYSYYEVKDGENVYISSTSKRFTVKNGYYYKDSDKSDSKRGIDLETSWTTSVPDSAIVGVEKTLPGLTGKTKSTNSPSNEAVDVYYTIKVLKMDEDGKYTEDVTEDVISDGNKFKAIEEGSYKFVYTVKDFYGNTPASSASTTFTIDKVKDTQAPEVFMYDAGTAEEEGYFVSAEKKLKTQTNNRNIIMYAISGKDNMVASDELTLKREIHDGSGITRFVIGKEDYQKQYNSYNLIFAASKADSESLYTQIVSDNYEIYKQLVLANVDVTNANAIKNWLIESNYLIVTTKYNKDIDNNDIVEDAEGSAEDVKDADITAMLEAGYAYIPSQASNKQYTFTEQTYNFYYYASDNKNNNKETSIHSSIKLTEDFTDNSVPTLNFSTTLQSVYLPDEKIEFAVATASDTVDSASRLDVVTAYRFLSSEKTAVASTLTDKTLTYVIRGNVNSQDENKWYVTSKDEKGIVSSEGWYYSDEANYKINLADAPAAASYVEILCYAIDDYGNAGFFNKIVKIADAEDGEIPVLYKVVNAPETSYEAPNTIKLPTLSYKDNKAEYMNAQVIVYKVTTTIVDGENVITKKVMQSSGMSTYFDSIRGIFTVDAGLFNASTAGEYQVEITVVDSGNHSITTYFNYNVIGGVIVEDPEIENITSETKSVAIDEKLYLNTPTIAVSKSDAYGYIGLGNEDDSNAATYYTTSIISASTNHYKIDQYYFTPEAKGNFKLQYNVFLIRYKQAEIGNSLTLEGDMLKYTEGTKTYYVYYDRDGENELGELDGSYKLHFNTSKYGDGEELEDLTTASQYIKGFELKSNVQTITSDTVVVKSVSVDDAYEKTQYTIVGENLSIVKPNVVVSGKGTINKEESTVQISVTSGSTTQTLATIKLSTWESAVEDNDNFIVEGSNIKLKLSRNGKYTIKYSIQAQDEIGQNVGDAKTLEYTITNGDTIAPTIDFDKVIEAKYNLNDELVIDMSGITVSDSVTTDTDKLLETILVKLTNKSTGESWTLDNSAEEEGMYSFEHKLTTAGDYTLTISIKDEAGNKAEKSTSFSVSSKESKAVNVKEVLGGVLIGLSVALLAGVVVYFIVSKVKLDKKEKTYSQRGRK